MKKPIAKFFNNQHGAAFVEFALVLPILLILVGGIVEFGFLYYNKQVLTNASREGVRAGIVYEFDENGNRETADISQIAQDYANDRIFPFNQNHQVSVTAPNQAELATLAYPDEITVTVEHSHTFFLSSLLNVFNRLSGTPDTFGPTISISGTTVMRME